MEVKVKSDFKNGQFFVNLYAEFSDGQQDLSSGTIKFELWQKIYYMK